MRQIRSHAGVCERRLFGLRHRSLIPVAAFLAVLVCPGAPAVSGNPVIDPEFAAAAVSQPGRISRTAIVARKSQVVEVEAPYATALVADTEIADVVPLSDHSVYVLGKKVGDTFVLRLPAMTRNLKLVKLTTIHDE